MGSGKDMLDMTTLKKFGKLNFIKSKNIFSVKDPVKRIKRQATD